MPGLREREQTGQKHLLETGLPLANRSHCLKITTLLWQNMNHSRGGRFPFLMSIVNKISLQPRALCFRDLGEGEPRNSHPPHPSPGSLDTLLCTQWAQASQSWRSGSWQDCAAVCFWLVHPDFPRGEPECTVQGASRSRGSWYAMGSLPSMARGGAQGTVRVWGLCSAPRPSE